VYSNDDDSNVIPAKNGLGNRGFLTVENVLLLELITEAAAAVFRTYHDKHLHVNLKCTECVYFSSHVIALEVHDQTRCFSLLNIQKTQIIFELVPALYFKMIRHSIA
jgi:hypothetical protein